MTLRITAFAPRSGTGLTKLTVTLPKGLSFTKLSAGLHVTDAHGHKLRYNAKLVHGALTITLRHAAGSVIVIVNPASISESSQLARTTKAKHTRHVALTIGLSGTHGLAARDPLSATVVS